jgi:type I restriction enzyme S subunit
MLPEGWRGSNLGECARFLSGGTPSKDVAAFWNGDFPWITARDMKSFKLERAGLMLSEQGKTEVTIAPANAVLVLTRGMTLLKDLPVGVACRSVAFNQDIKALVTHAGVDPWFLGYQLLARKREILALVDTAGHGTGRLDTDQLKAFEVRLPPLREQRAIAALLSTWDDAISVAGELLSNWLEQLRLTRETLVATALRHPCVPLSEVAEVRTGLAKGKRAQSAAIEVPYLRVANVQDGHLDLKEVKLIQVAPEQVGRYALQTGDVLMTEGGDFDKLGRGSVWTGEIDPCLHQNHVFAVRSQPALVRPGFIAALAASDYGRSYFLSCAKRSTNLASINSTQLKALPVPLVPMVEQARFVAVMETAMQAARASKDVLDRLVQEKSALLADLLTGRRRVRLPEVERPL